MTGATGRLPRWEGAVGGLGGLLVAWLSIGPRLWDPITSEEASGVRGAGWTALLTGWDAPTNPPVLLWLANGFADGLDVVGVGRALAMCGTLGAAAGVGWVVGRRVGWLPGALAGAMLVVMPPLVIDGARVRGYGPATLCMVVHLGAWLQTLEGGPRTAARWVRGISGGLAVYTHYLMAPLLLVTAVGFGAVSSRRRQDGLDTLAMMALWLPTLVWILGEGNPPRVSQEGVDRVLWYVWSFSTQRGPFGWPALSNLWPEGAGVALVPAALVLLGPLGDRRARGLRAVAILQLLALSAIGMGLLVRAPAAALALPATLLAIWIGLGAVPIWRRALVGLPVALWVSSGVQHRLDDDPMRRQFDAREVLEVVSHASWEGRTVRVPNQGVFVLLDLVANRAPFDAPGRDPVAPRCVDTAGARFCRGAPEVSEAFLRPLPREGEPPRGCVAEARGRGWGILRCDG